MRKGIGPNNLGAPKSPAKQTSKLKKFREDKGKKPRPRYLDETDRGKKIAKDLKSGRIPGETPKGAGAKKSPAKQRNQRALKRKIAKEMGKDTPDAKKINRLENRREVRIAKDKVKSVKTKQKIKKIENKKSRLDNPNAAG